jgi:putative transposase
MNGLIPCILCAVRVLYRVVSYAKTWILRGEIAQRLEQLVHEGADEHSWHVLNLSIQLDHVHLVIRSNPYTLPTDIARFIKGRSSHVLREEVPYLQRMPSLCPCGLVPHATGQRAT